MKKTSIGSYIAIWIIALSSMSMSHAMSTTSQVQSLTQKSAQVTAKKLSEIIYSKIYFSNQLKAAHDYLGQLPQEVQEKVALEFHEQNLEPLIKVLELIPLKTFYSINPETVTLNPEETLLVKTKEFGVGENISIFEVKEYNISPNPKHELQPPIELQLHQAHSRGQSIIKFSQSGRFLTLNFSMDNLQGLLIWEVIDNNINPNVIADIRIHQESRIITNISIDDTLLAIATEGSVRVYNINELSTNPNYEPTIYPLPHEFLAFEHREIIIEPKFNKERSAIIAGFAHKIFLEDDEEEQDLEEGHVINGPSYTLNYYLYQWKLAQPHEIPQPPQTIATQDGIGLTDAQYHPTKPLLIVSNIPSANSLNTSNVLMLPLKKGLVNLNVAPEIIELPVEMVDEFRFINDGSKIILTGEMWDDEEDNVDDGDRSKIKNIVYDIAEKNIHTAPVVLLFDTKFNLVDAYEEAISSYSWNIYVFPQEKTVTLDQMLFLVSLEKLRELTPQDILASGVNVEQYVKRAVTDLKLSATFNTFDPVIRNALQQLLNNIEKDYKLYQHNKETIPHLEKASRMSLAVAAALFKKEPVPGVVTRRS